MKKTHLYLIFLTFILSTNVMGQKPSMELTFTAKNDNEYVQLNHIVVENKTQGGDTLLYYPDTVLVLNFPVNINENGLNTDKFSLFPNSPNPFDTKTSLYVYIPKSDNIKLNIYNIYGEELISQQFFLNKGIHSFTFESGKYNTYIFTAYYMNEKKSFKMICLTQNNNLCEIKYIGLSEKKLQHKSSENRFDFNYAYGDELMYIGYTNLGEVGLVDIPLESKTYEFQFATNTPCIGIPYIIYGGQIYNTIQIYGQCWLKENLNIGSMIQGNQDMEDNSVIEKYCFDDDLINCIGYGGLYQWDEVMQYTTQPGTQGICPEGWHIPTDNEFKLLEGYVDSQYGIGDPVWDGLAWRGYDVGDNLKSLGGWTENGNGNDSYGFTVLPAGKRETNGLFGSLSSNGYFWSSDESDQDLSWDRYLSYSRDNSNRGLDPKIIGLSIRCLKNY